jgi:hypothetical protein
MMMATRYFFARDIPTYLYIMYVKNPVVINDKFNMKLRRRFRMSHSQYIEILARVKSHEIFAK